MNKHFKLQSALVVAAIVLLPAAHAAGLTKTDYSAGKSRISAGFKADKANCASLAGNAKDICIEEAKGRQNVSLAELEYGYTGKPADQNKVLVARAESAYAVARERCDDLAGNVKDVCVAEAKAAETKALANAKLGQQIGEATTDASEVKRTADYTVAVEKCDALSGDAMAACVSNAKAQFGKN